MQTKIVKMLTSKTKISDCGDAYKFCLELWDDLSLALIDLKGSSVVLPSKERLSLMQGCKVVLRLALLADFYRYQKEDLALYAKESDVKVCGIRSDALRLLLIENIRPSAKTFDHGCMSERGCVSDRGCMSDRGCVSDRGCIPDLGCVPEGDCPGGARQHMRRHGPITGEPTVGTVLMKFQRVVTEGKAWVRRDRKKPYSLDRARHGEDNIKWSKYSFSAPKKPYYTKLIKAFQVVKHVGHPMLTLHSEWGLSCYYKLAVAYTTDQPLELAAACLPELREAVDIIHSECFQKLSELKLECQMLLYAVLNCHINWVDHNHRQILLVPGQPSEQPPPRQQGDLRCSRCLKNQTFHSSEVKGNPRNIDVEFDFEQMKFGSSCCAAPVINVPLSTSAVNTCTFTEMKQMYTSCMTCKQPIFSEVLVDVETLYRRCVVCTSNGLR